MTLQDAILLAVEAHKGDIDKAGLPYILHPMRVMNAVLKVRPKDLDAAAAAVLHDVKEDHPVFYLNHVYVGLTNRQRKIIGDLSRRKDIKETYRQFINRVKASTESASILIKLADMVDNMSRPSPSEVKAKAILKYGPYLPELSALVPEYHHAG